MFRLALILFGGDALLKRWRIFLAAGMLIILLGAVVLIDLGDGVANIASWVFGAILLLQGVIELVVGATHAGSRRRFEMFRGFAMVFIACLVLDFPWDNAITAGVLFAAAFSLNGLIRIAFSLLVRPPAWRVSLAIAVLYLVMAALLLSNWPLRDALNVSFCIGLGLLAVGFRLARGAWRLKSLPLGSRLAAIELYRNRRPSERNAPPAVVPTVVAGHQEPMVVHIWLAVNKVPDRIRMPFFEHYIVAFSRKGGASAGHASMECGSNLYISHHPSVPLRVAQSDFKMRVRATSDNDGPGYWSESYQQEVSTGDPSTLRIRFKVFNRDYLHSFWRAYQQDATYNLTHRNCSVAVVEAIDAGVEGVFADKPFWRTLLRLVFHPDMWLAGSVRVRADSIAWTPGLAMDYASALRRITHPRQDLRLRMWRRWKKSRRPLRPA